MKTDLFTLFDGYEDESIALAPLNAVSADCVKETVMNKLTPAPGRSRALSRRMGRVLLAAVLSVLLLGLAAMAVAHFRMEDIFLSVPAPEPISSDSAPDSGNLTATPAPEAWESASDADAAATPIPLTGTDTFISRAGLKGSPEYEAQAAWEAIVMERYAQGTLFDETTPDNLWTEELAPYTRNAAWTEDARADLDRILEEYGLHLPTVHEPASTPEELYALCGRESFLPQDPGTEELLMSYGGSYYGSDGFCLNAAGELSNRSYVNYNLDVLAKGCFSRRMLVDIDFDRQWAYTTESGHRLTLALGEDQAFILADLENCFVTLLVCAGTESARENGELAFEPLDAETLELLVGEIGWQTLNELCQN